MRRRERLLTHDYHHSGSLRHARFACLFRLGALDACEAIGLGNARDLLPVLDNLGRAIESFPGEDVPDESVLSLLRGVAAIERQMVQAFQQNGIQRFDPVGETFDPHLHQAVLQRPDAKVEPGTVVEVLQPGYRHHDRLLRPASVGVAAEHDSGSQR